MRALLFLVGSACSSPAAEPGPRSQAPAGFWELWGDGRAELAGYRVSQPRYGEIRRGEAVLITVTETFTDGQRVKSDGGHPDEFPVVKLNAALDFQTGLYDYNAMTSAFVRLDGADALGVPAKVSFGAQEWCGQVYDQVLVRGRHLERTSHSYFDGEADQSSKDAIPKGAFFLDAAPLLVRGLAGELVPVGGSVDVAVHPRLMDLRFQHRSAAWEPGTLTRSAVWAVGTPLGVFDTELWSLTVGDRTWTWSVEVAPPHRLIQWKGPDGEFGQITGSIREPYWQQNREGDEVRRRALGLGDPSWLRGSGEAAEATP